MFQRALVVSLVLSLVATPALARPWHRHGHHERRGHANRQDAYVAPYRYGAAHFRHHHRHHWRERRRYVVDDDVFLWLGVTAVGLTALYAFTHEQRRRYADAYRNAAAAPIGRPVYWDDGAVSGSVTPVHEGYTDDGEYCREFQQEVRIDDRRERAWGTACLQEDGSWRITR
jgi:hypothetical protein